MVVVVVSTSLVWKTSGCLLRHGRSGGGLNDLIVCIIFFYYRESFVVHTSPFFFSLIFFIMALRALPLNSCRVDET